MVGSLHLASFIILLSSVSCKESAVWTVRGGRAEIPCPLTPKFSGDRPTLVLWYRLPFENVIYSYDARAGVFETGIRWSDETVLGRRAYFRVITRPPSLIIDPVEERDHGTYRCRVEYSRSTSTFSYANVTVIIPPSPPTILWLDKSTVGATGPVLEGAQADLTCQTRGGRPPPKVTWWLGGRQLEAYSTVTDDTMGGEPVTRSTVSIIATRELLGVPLICHAQILNPGLALMTPRTTAVTLNITLPPLDVRIEGSSEPVSSGATVRLLCHSWGSHPPAELTWWRSGIRLTQVTFAMMDGGNVTTAALTLHPTSRDHLSCLTCRAVNSLLPHHTLSDTVTLNVYYSPEVELTLEGHGPLARMREGEEADFYCKVRANPSPHRVEWYHNNVPVEQDKGVTIDSWNLRIDSIGRHHAGTFGCSATNTEGQTTSNIVMLNVLYAPVCATGWEERTQGVPRGDALSLPCRVTANPSDKVEFSWSRLLDSGKEISLSRANITTEGLTSRLHMVVRTLSEFGTLLCRAANSEGDQNVPCKVHLVSAGPPDPPHNCSISPTPEDSLNIICLEGYHGGFPQLFTLKAWQGEELIANITSEFPEWTVGGLRENQVVKLHIWAYNPRGSSSLVTMDVQTITAHRQSQTQSLGEEVDWLSPLVGSLVGILVVTAMMSIVAVLLVRRNRLFHSAKAPKSSEDEMDMRIQSVQDPDVVTSVYYHKRTSSLEFSSDKEDDSGSVQYDSVSFHRQHQDAASVTVHDPISGMVQLDGASIQQDGIYALHLPSCLHHGHQPIFVYTSVPNLKQDGGIPMHVLRPLLAGSSPVGPEILKTEAQVSTPGHESPSLKEDDEASDDSETDEQSDTCSENTVLEMPAKPSSEAAPEHEETCSHKDTVYKPVPTTEPEDTEDRPHDLPKSKYKKCAKDTEACRTPQECVNLLDKEEK